MYGWRARIGLLVPAINTTMETEAWRVAPPGVSVHTARIAGGRAGTPETLRAMDEEGQQAAARLAMVEPDVAIFACTSGSFFEGPGWDGALAERLGKIVGAPVVTAAGAMAAALATTGARRVDLVTPYVADTNRRLVAFLAAAGVTVSRLASFDMLDMFDHAKVAPAEIYRTAKATASADSDALFIACTQLRALELVALLERDLKKPVVSAVQACLWQAFATVGIDPGRDDLGSLIRGLAPGRRS